MLTKLVAMGVLFCMGDSPQSIVNCSNQTSRMNTSIEMQEKSDQDSTKSVLKVELKALADSTSEYVDKDISVVGTLKNEGKNYFGDLRIYLLDQEDNKVPVLPWLPLSIPPLPDNSKVDPPRVLSAYLNKRVRIEGVIKENTSKRIKEKYVLAVQSAEIMK